MNEIAKSRKERLRACEKALAEHMEEFVRVGLALKEIRDDKLYDEDGYETFEEYCKGKWGISRSYAYKTISSAELRLSLPSPSNVDESSTWTEFSVRELNRLGSPTKAKAVAGRVIREVEKTGKKLTAAVVRKHVDKELGIDRTPKEPELPEFHEVVHKWVGQLKGMADLIEGTNVEGLELFAQEEPELVKDLAEAIGRLSEAWRRVRPPSDAGERVLENVG